MNVILRLPVAAICLPPAARVATAVVAVVPATAASKRKRAAVAKKAVAKKTVSGTGMPTRVQYIAYIVRGCA